MIEKATIINIYQFVDYCKSSHFFSLISKWFLFTKRSNILKAYKKLIAIEVNRLNLNSFRV